MDYVLVTVFQVEFSFRAPDDLTARGTVIDHFRQEFCKRLFRVENGTRVLVRAYGS